MKHRLFATMMLPALAVAMSWNTLGAPLPTPTARPNIVFFLAVENGESTAKPEDCRGIIVGPGVNQPDLSTGGHATTDAQQNAIRCIRLRVRADHSGIELLPAPNR